jgi:hypothetical protein
VVNLLQFYDLSDVNTEGSDSDYDSDDARQDELSNADNDEVAEETAASEYVAGDEATKYHICEEIEKLLSEASFMAEAAGGILSTFEYKVTQSNID